MATNPYEVEHNIKASSTPRPHRRRPDMSSFTSFRDSLTSDPSSSSHALGPTPVDMAGLYQIVQDQYATLASSAPSDANRDFLSSLIRELEADAGHPPDHIAGVDQAYLDGLDRVSRQRLEAQAAKTDDEPASCPICAERFLDDPHPLVVELPCHGAHIFDLECVGPWLQTKGTCPMCRTDLTVRYYELLMMVYLHI
ncbi:hypothetical protein F4777DRAFT_557645 [Nemania sp. FL0916]|nr:hypothetical protein F4777DRAFT_557645 [Nemania sp. FL0916]